MIAISLWQPWATAIALGLKNFETRSWPAAWRGPLAIHAAKRDTPDTRGWWMEYIKRRNDPWAVAAREKFAAAGFLDFCDLPLGQVVATCELVAVHRTEELVDGRLKSRGTPMEFAFGNYAPDRYAWELTKVVPLATPAPAKGWQNFFTWDPATNATKGMPPASRGKPEEARV